MTDSNAPNSDPPPPDDADRAQRLALVANLMRGAGALFMAGGAALGLNLGGAADMLGIASIAKIVGGVLFAMGIMDFFVLPQIVMKAVKPKDPV